MYAIMSKIMPSPKIPDYLLRNQRLLELNYSQVIKWMRKFPLAQLSQWAGISSRIPKTHPKLERLHYLAKHGWLYTSISDGIVEEWKNKKRDEQSIGEYVIEFFRKDDFHNLKTLVQGWKNIKGFDCRQQIFNEALDVHKAKCFNASITLMAVHTEGVISDFAQTIHGSFRWRISKAINDIREHLKSTDMGKTLSQSEISPFYFFNILRVLEDMKEIFEGNFNKDNPNATPDYNRNKIAHGYVISRKPSLTR